MDPSPHYPVAIIGSGPIGLTLTNLLGVYGTPCAIFERNPLTVQEPRAVSIDDESLRTMQSAGVIDEVIEHVVTGYGSIYFGPDRTEFARVVPTGRPFGYPRRNAFRQPILEQQLRDALARFPHVGTFFGWELLDYRQTADGVSLRLKGPDGERTVTCDYLVGCDGAASRVREKLGIELAGTTFDERWLIIDLENNRNTTRHTEVYCDPKRPCITLPGPNDTRRYEFKVLAGEADASLLDPAMIAHLLATHGADPAATLRRKVVYRFHARSAPTWSVGRVFLAGDAAHLTPPFAGQGMNSGIRDAQNLAWKLAAVTSGRLGPNVLQTYQQERKAHLWQMINLALTMGKIMAPRTALHGVLTRGFFRTLNVWPAARDYVAEMKYKPAPFFAAGFLVPRQASKLVGRLLPQPQVATGGEELLLDELLGTGFALVLRTADPRADFARLSQPIWDKLGVRRIALTPPDVTCPAVNGVTVARERGHELDAALAACEGCAILLRPDHYVAAVIPLAEADTTAAEIEALVARTWEGQAQEAAMATV